MRTTTTPAIVTTAEIDALVASNCPVAIGVSGGKDSQAAALATIEHLDAVGHRGPRVLIHSDLGSVEWLDSMPACEKLAEHLEIELVVVRRKAGDLMDRWESRWQSSLNRYANLETVTVVLPWSTPSMRFCTSELKTHIIEAELKRRFKGQVVVNVTGVRAEESVAAVKGSLAHWRPILRWTIGEVFACIASNGLAAHRAYAEFGMSRVSCRFCIMSNQADLTAAAAQPESHDLYRRMVALEADSTFAFQGDRWLGDVAPHLLTDELRAGLAKAKANARHRKALESSITDGMLYEKGWPTRMLTDDEADTLARVRADVCGLLGIEGKHLDRASIHARYAELMAENARKVAEKAKAA
jgi:3'-phosphoadenosine 5'-phosphosulfate sulfotransferase (PAPS reductase)/FAD synthetase